MRATRLLIILTTLASPGAAMAQRAAYEGVWARSERECRDEDGPNSRTLIDLRDRKLGPLVDRYENHCRVLRTEQTASGAVLHLRCHEFWEEFEKRQRPYGGTAQIVVRNAQAITIDGRAYVRCLR